MSAAHKMYKYECDRKRRMPDMIEATERKLAGLYREAIRYQMDKLLQEPNLINGAWNREVTLAYLEHLEAQRAH